jgi:hypothetical protein
MYESDEDENEDDSDIDSEESDIIYQPEEQSTTKYNIILCELYNTTLHGLPEKNSNVEKHFLVNSRFKKLDIELIDDIADHGNALYVNLVNKNHRAINKHPIYRNYKTIVSIQPYIKPEIAECITLPTNERVAILKTVWIRLIQRTWKNVVKDKKHIILLRRNIESIKYRELNGRWPETCNTMPRLQGMLVY